MSTRATGLTRRQFLLASFSALLAACSESGQDSDSPPGKNTISLRDALPPLLGNREAAARLGRVYLEAHPEYSTVDLLLKEVERALASRDAAAAGTQDITEAATAIRKLVADQYKRGEVETVSGWILSVTEAQLYALSFLELD